MNDARRKHRVERVKAQCLERIQRCVGIKLPREALSAVNDLVEQLDQLRAIADEDLDDTVVGRKR